MSRPEDIKGPIIKWINNGYEGWSPYSYATIKDALLNDNYGSEFVITELLEFEVTKNAKS